VTVVLGVRWVARPGNEERVAEILAELVRATASEPGCLQYDAHRDRDEPGTFFLFERYVDEEALRAHEASAHVRTLVFGEAVELLASRERRYYEPLP
jgi:quinol monooxygenase YgiN